MTAPVDAPTRYFEDFQVGDTWESAPFTLAAEEILDYGRRYDPQPMHADPGQAQAGPLGGLVASGWQVAALTVREFVKAGGYGKTPVVGMGIDEVRWLAPVRAGDTLVVRREVVEVRRSASRPDQGIVRTRISVHNQHGQEVLAMVGAGKVAARPARAT